MVEMHLLSVNVDFDYNPIYALGVVTSFNRFMLGYRPERDKESIFDALCQAVGNNSEHYQQDSERLKTIAERVSGQDLVSWFSSPTPIEAAGDFHSTVSAIAHNPKFKYSRLFAIGIYTLLELADAELVKGEKQRNDALKAIADALHLPNEKLQKDLELYRSNLEKMAQAQIVMEDVIKAERKKREQRAQDKNKATAATGDASQDEASSS
jgi:photosystem II biogenesis protein Psp29